MEPIKSSDYQQIQISPEQSENADILALANEALSSDPTGWNKGLAAYTAACTAFSAVGVSLSGTIGAVSSSVWGFFSSPPPASEQLSESAHFFHFQEGGKGFKTLDAFASNKPLALPDQDVRELPDEIVESSIIEARDALVNALIAFDRLCFDRDIELTDENKKEVAEDLKETFEKIVNNPSFANDGIMEIRTKLMNKLKDWGATVSKKEFKKELDLTRGRTAPEILMKKNTINETEVTEKAVMLPTSIGADYLDAVGMHENADLIRDIPGIRVSEAKPYPEVAGKSINLWKQSVATNDGEAASVLRSGAFSVHGEKSHSIKRLATVLAMEEGPEKEAAIKNLEKIKEGMTVQQTYDKLMSFGIAQALPKLLASLQDSAEDPIAFQNALLSGSFLHAEFSYLSFFLKERHMIHDMEEVVGYLNDHLKVTFVEPDLLSDKPYSLNTNGDNILIKLPRPKHLEDDLDFKGIEFNVKTLMFNQGVNFGSALNTYVEATNFGQYKKRDLGVYEQTELNNRSLEELKKHALAVYEKPDTDKDSLKSPSSCFLETLQSKTVGTWRSSRSGRPERR